MKKRLNEIFYIRVSLFLTYKSRCFTIIDVVVIVSAIQPIFNQLSLNAHQHLREKKEYFEVVHLTVNIIFQIICGVFFPSFCNLTDIKKDPFGKRWTQKGRDCAASVSCLKLHMGDWRKFEKLRQAASQTYLSRNIYLLPLLSRRFTFSKLRSLFLKKW